MHPRNKALLLLVLCFSSGGIVGYVLHAPSGISDPTWGPIRAPHGEYKMIQPLLACDFPSDVTSNQLHVLKTQLENDISDAAKNDKSINASVYLRPVNSGGSLGINEEKLYNPASMFKVVLMMTYARIAETHPDLFDKKLTMTDAIWSEEGVGNYYGTSSLIIGESYRVGDLIDTMIINSDNGAKDLLLKNIPTDELFRTLKDFGLEASKSETNDLMMSPKDISLFFRTLYSATYLDNLHSEVALEILSRTTFKDGLVAGLPYGTLVAHKYGEFVDSSKSGNVDRLELHDCGIVYAPGNTYYLCVMTEGGTHEKLAKLISAISQHVYYTMTSPR